MEKIKVFWAFEVCLLCSWLKRLPTAVFACTLPAHFCTLLQNKCAASLHTSTAQLHTSCTHLTVQVEPLHSAGFSALHS